MEYHDLANTFELLDGAEFQALVDDIRQHGQQEPITLLDGRILDGRNRYRACMELGIEPTFQEFTGDDPLAFVYSMNLHRRHLTPAQRAAYAADIMPALEAAAKERMKAGAVATNAGCQKIDYPEEEIGRSTEQAAKQISGINRQYVSDAVKLKSKSPEVFNAVKAGQINILVAREIASIDDNETQQSVLTEAIKAGKSKAVKVVRAAVKEEKKAKIAGLDTGASGNSKRVVHVGEWWKLGRHLLYCGGTTSNEFVDTLPQVAFAFADPPYGAGVDDWDGEFVWKHDYLADKAKIVAVTPGIVSIFELAHRTQMPYKWSLATWIANSHARGAVGFGNWIYTALFSHGSVHRNAQDFNKVSIPLSDIGATKHEGRKPTEYIAWLLDTFTGHGDTVIDPFGGSGTTLLVAERLARTCIMGEIVPDFCMEIIGRWEEDTGQSAELMSKEKFTEPIAV